MTYISNMHNVSVASNISVAPAVSVAPDISEDTPYRYRYTPVGYMYTPVGYIPSRGYVLAGARIRTCIHVHACVHACVLRK